MISIIVIIWVLLSFVAYKQSNEEPNVYARLFGSAILGAFYTFCLIVLFILIFLILGALTI